MLPKKAKHYIIPAAERLELDSELVDDIIFFYYSELRKALVNMRHIAINIPNLGTLEVRKNKLEEVLAYQEKHYNTINPTTFNRIKIKKELADRIVRSKRLLKLLDEELNRKTAIKQYQNGLKKTIQQS